MFVSHPLRKKLYQFQITKCSGPLSMFYRADKIFIPLIIMFVTQSNDKNLIDKVFKTSRFNDINTNSSPQLLKI